MHDTGDYKNRHEGWCGEGEDREPAWKEKTKQAQKNRDARAMEREGGDREHGHRVVTAEAGTKGNQRNGKGW
jgi:hypothetical protein